jgi:hypothetical protein
VLTDVRDLGAVDALAQAAVGAFGLTPAGFCAQATVDAARNQHADTTQIVHQQALADLQAELFRVRVAVNQVRAEVSRALDAAVVSRDLDKTIASAASSLNDLDDVIARIHRRLGQHGPTAEGKP